MEFGRTWMVVALALFVAVGCGRKDDDRSITAVSEQAPPGASATVATASTVAPGANAPVANPLAMPLKHDGPAPSAAASAVDPCAVVEPTGALAMPLKHGAQPQKNPLCMKLK
jgi:hypothetical protein